MNKEQAIHAFWSSFDIPAYDENSVPNSAKPPYITYDVVTGNFGTECAMSASIYYYSSSWAGATEKLHEIERYLTRGGIYLPIEGGSIWIKRGSPFAQRMGDANDDFIRRIFINISAEFITEI